MSWLSIKAWRDSCSRQRVALRILLGRPWLGDLRRKGNMVMVWNGERWLTYSRN